MQTFLPYPDYEESAQVLDRARLGKQRVEAFQILRAMDDRTSRPGWTNHPATRMWRGYGSSLCRYGLAMCWEWIARGYRDSLAPRFAWYLADFGEGPDPAWLGDPGFHASHRSNLLRKMPAHYLSFGWCETPNLPYVWPNPVK